MENPTLQQFNLQDLAIHSRLDFSKQSWDSFVEKSMQAWLYHTYDMQDAVSTWPGKSDLSFAVVDERQSGEIVALLPLQKLARPFLKMIPNCRLESLGGIAYNPNLSLKQISQVSKTIMDILLTKAKDSNAEEIRISLPALTPSMRGEACPRVNPLISLGMESVSSQTYLINLQKTKNEIWDDMESFCRTHIRKAEKTGYSVRQASTQQDLEIYYDLHCKTYHRTSVKPHPFQYFENIWNNFVSNGRAVVFFAELDGKTVAADNEAVFKKAVSGWTAAGEGKSTSGVNNLLHWTAIQWAMDNGFDYYESGEGFPGERGGKRKGLTDFKKSFGGDLYPIYRGRLIQRNIIHNFRNFIQSIGKG